MIVGAAVVELHVHASQSLKQKRGVVRSVVQRGKVTLPLGPGEPELEALKRVLSAEC